jgi:hypothetical protein
MVRWHHPVLFKCSSRRNYSVGQWRCIWFGKIAVRKQAVESACLNLQSLNFRIINSAGLSHYGINCEQQTVLCLRQCVRICMYVNVGTKVQDFVFQFRCLSFRTVPTLINRPCKIALGDTQFMTYITSYMIRHWGVILREPLSQMYISHRANQGSSRPCRNSCNHKMNFNILHAIKNPIWTTQTICSKTYTAVVIN